MRPTRRIAAASAALLATATAAVLTACGSGSSTPHPAAATSPLVATTTVTATATVTAPAPPARTATVTRTATAPAPAPVTRTVTVTRTRTVAAPAPAGICGPVRVAAPGPSAAHDVNGWIDHVFVCARTNMTTGAALNAQLSVQLAPSEKIVTVPTRILTDASGDQTGVTASVAGFKITMIGFEQLSCSRVTWTGSATTWTATMPVCGR